MKYKLKEIQNQIRALESDLDDIKMDDKDFDKLMNKIIIINNILSKLVEVIE